MPACDDAVARRAILCGAAHPSEHEGVSNRSAARANRNRIFLGISARIFVATPRNSAASYPREAPRITEFKCRAYEPMKRCPTADGVVKPRSPVVRRVRALACRGRQRDRNPFDCVQVSLLRRPDDHRRNVRWRETNAPTIAEDQDRHLMTVGASRLEAVPAVDGRQWRRLFDEPFRRRVGQRRHGKLLLVAENRTDRRKGLPDARDAARADMFDYIENLQYDPQALDQRLPQPG